MSIRPAAIMRLLLVAAAGLTIALLWSLHEGKRAHALEAAPAGAQLIDALPAPVKHAVKPVAHLAHVAAPITNLAAPVADTAANTLTPIVQPVAGTLAPVVQPVLDTVAPVLRPAVGIVSPTLPSAPPTLPAIPVLQTAPRGPSATAVAHVIATAVAQVAGDTAGFARHFMSTAGSFPSLSVPGISMPTLPAVPLPALPASFPSPVPLSHAPGGLGRTSGGGLAVLVAAAAAASLRGRRFRYATGVGQSIFLASLIERPG